MPGLSLFADPAPPAVRRPVVEVAFGQAPAAAWGRHLVSLTVERALAPGVDVVELVVAAPGGGAAAGGGALGAALSAAPAALSAAAGGADEPPAAAPGDGASVSLGYADGSAEPVFRGAVTAAARRLDGTFRLTAAGGAAALARLRLARSWEGRSAGRVVRDLAAAAGVATATVEDGPELAFFALDDRTAAWSAIAELAAHGGLLAAIDAEGRLEVRAPAAGDPVQTFRYGEDVLELAVRESGRGGGVRLVGEGAAGAHGQEAWSWLVKDPAAVTAEAGEGPFSTRLDGALRSSDAVRRAAAGLDAAAGRATLAGWLRVPGAPALAPGRTFALDGAPAATMNGEMLVCRVRHRFDAAGGFTSRVWFRRAAAPAGGGLGAAIGGLL